MNIDSSLTIAGIISVVSLISPVITTLINNYYDLKKRKIDTCYSNQCKSLDQFTKSAINYYGDSLTWMEMTLYNNSLNNLYIYFENVDDSLFLKLDEYRSSKQISDYKNTLNLIVKTLSKQIVKIK